MSHDPVTRRIAALLQASSKTQAEIAEEVGWPRANVVAMVKTGATKLPLRKAGSLAIALDADPVHLTRLALETYQPEIYEAIRECLGEMVSENEREILSAIRRATNDGDPHLTNALEEGLGELFRPAPPSSP